MADIPIDDGSLELLDPASPPGRKRAIVRAWIGAAAGELRRSGGRAPEVGAASLEAPFEESLEAALAGALADAGDGASLSVEQIRDEAERLARVAEERGLLHAANSSPAPESAVLFALADLAHREAPAAPARALLLGRLVLSLAPRCSDSGSRLAADLEAAAWTAIADGHIRATDVVSGDEALERARDARSRGTADPLLDARWETAATNLRCDQSRFREALIHARRARRIYAEIGQPHEAAKARIRVAIQLYHLGEPLERVIHELDRALPDLHVEREPRAFAAARQNLARFLADAGRLDEAEALLPELRRLARELDNPYDPARVEWLAANIAAQRGRYAEAERRFREVIEVWNAAEFEYDAALATLELTAVLLALGKTDEVRRNAEQLLPVFRGLGVAPEALATLQLVTAAARRDALERALVEKLVAQLRGRPDRPASSRT